MLNQTAFVQEVILTLSTHERLQERRNRLIPSLRLATTGGICKIDGLSISLPLLFSSVFYKDAGLIRPGKMVIMRC